MIITQKQQSYEEQGETYLVFLQLSFVCCLSSLCQSIIPVLDFMTKLCNL